MFVGYQGESSNYRVYDPNTKKVTVSKNVYFNENSHLQNYEPSDLGELRISLEQEDHKHPHVNEPEEEDEHPVQEEEQVSQQNA